MLITDRLIPLVKRPLHSLPGYGPHIIIIIIIIIIIMNFSNELVFETSALLTTLALTMC